MSDWARFILDHYLWYRLCGLKENDADRCCKIWQRFWSRYRCINPGHEIFRRPNHDFSRTCAIMIHGDEGRSLRKAAMMVISAHSILGFGLSTSSSKKKNEYKAQRLNYEEPTWSTRFLLSVLPKHYYSEDSENLWPTDPFQQLMAAICEDIRALYDTGVETPLGRFYFCTISVMGDWPFIQKCGNLSRSCFNISKAASSRTASKGICHLCKADMTNVVWTDFQSEPPSWLPTVNTLSGFVEPPAALRLPKNNDFPEALFAWDLFHAWHLGAGKTFLASALSALILSSAYQGSVDLRCEQITADYQAWSKSTRQRCQLRRITKVKLGGLSSTSYPSGAWSKGSTTTVLMRFFIYVSSKYQEDVDRDVLLQLAQRAAIRMNEFVRGLYSHELWVPAENAKPIVRAGLAFLNLYGCAVKISFNRKILNFQLMPNLHRLHHIMWAMQEQATQTVYVLNPLHAATQADEDYIGRPCRVSRRVSPRLTIQRTLERSLQACYAQYVRVGAIIP
eukprot:Skav216812  [mRNA]  locus=scaffold135:76492:78012:- [translate_table: standard]